MKRSAIKRGDGSRIDPNVRQKVLHRDRGCVGQRLPGSCAGGLEVHHIVNRSQGRDDDPEHLVALCTAHHAWVTDHPRDATNRGFTIPGWVRDDERLWPVAVDWAWCQRTAALPGVPPWLT